MSERNPLYRILPSRSETAARLMQTDWSASPLGPVDAWPEALRAALGICMNSRFPMFVWWGEQLINFYNDAYIPILGQRHPDAFGRPAPEVWSEIWDVIGRQADAVMTRGEATWNERVLLVMERNGFAEETYFTWSYSPIPDGRGGIGGLFCACTEETPRIRIERERDRLLEQLAYERSQLSEVFARSPVCMALVRTPDYQFEYANQRYIELIGGRDPTGMTVAEAVPEVAEQGVISLLDRVVQTAEPFTGQDVPVRLRRAMGVFETRYLDFIYQPMFGPDGRVNGVLGHAIDMTERRRTEARDRFFVQLDDAVRPLTDAAEITRTCARLLGEHLDADRCAYADVEADEDTFNLTGDYTRGVPSIVGRYTFTAFGHEVLQLMRAGHVYRVDDVDTHQPPIGDTTAYRLIQLQAVVCVPVLKAGRFVAAMAVHQATPRTWTDREVDLVVHVAHRCWESIERARVERELRWSERRFRAAVEATSNIFWTCTATGEFVTEQPGWAAFTGQTFEQYRGYGWMDAVHPDDAASTLEQWHASVSAQRMLVMRHRLRRRDGSYRVCSVRAAPLQGEVQGGAREWVGVHTDISERVEFESSLAESEARFRMLSDSAPVMIWLTDADGRCQYVNQRWCEFTGQSLDQALGAGWMQAVHADDYARAHAAFIGDHEQPAGFVVEYRLRRMDGSYRWCVDSASPRRGVRGELIGYVGSVIDITERKQVEEALAAEKRVLELIATGSPLPDVLDTLVRRLESQSADGMLCSILLASDDGRQLLDGAAPSLPDEYRRASNNLPIAADVGACGAAAFERRTIICADLGSDPRWASARELVAAHGLAACTSNPIIGSDGRVLGTLALYYRQPRVPGERDMELSRLGTHLAGIVIEKHQLDQRLRQSLDAEQQARGAAEHASRMKDEFLATLSHELRSPLNAILGWVSILRLKHELSGELAQGIDVIERNARAQAQIIQDLLDMSSIISGKVTLEVQPVSLDALVRSAVETALPAAQAKQIAIDLEIEPAAAVTIQADPNRLQQVMWNLLSNAVKFTPRGGRIAVQLAQQRSDLRISVRDSGEGIDPEFLPYVFDRFRQADASIVRRHGGLGLGLSIVRRLAELHGGSVLADSAGAGQGATFTVLLPLPAGAQRPGEPRASEPLAVSGRLVGKHLLVVDDDADARLMMQRLLEGTGARVAPAGSVDEALAVLAQAPFDLLVSDIGMPGADGYELIRRVRAGNVPANREVPAIAVTAYARAQDRIRALQSGFQQHIAKPVDPASLLEIVTSLVQSQDAADGAR
ncbi:MAG: hypothetical protein AVDCRST_MAG71-861 [uncultured Lysobacter sp.]|uniref:histidine kinase n=1 Tax=uncultured Lysobacter sp. TaxID=271060 RepID=A0A6J4KQZ9_9GAMM|nr:MAG: hypothetical protein AVDCRST_MAG71-861 [uncultured Lysobacter sp.]